MTSDLEHSKAFSFSRSIRFLSLILIISIILCVVVEQKDLNAATHLDATIKHTISLQSNIGVLYSVKINSNDTYTDLRLHLERQVFSGSSSSSTWEEIDLTDYTYEGGCYVFSYSGLSATEMTNGIKATLYAKKGNATYFSDKDQFSVRSYAAEMLSEYQNSGSADDKKLCTFLVDLLNYGAEAQKLYKINTSDLANKNLTPAQKKKASVLPTSFTSCYKYTAINNPSASINGFTLENNNTVDLVPLIKFSGTPSSNTSLEVKYKGVDGLDKKTTVNSFTYDSNYGCYKACIDSISLADYSTPLTIVIKKGNTAISGTYTYSVESCMKDLSAYGMTDLNNLLKYCLACSKSAKAMYEKGSVVTPTVTPSITPPPSPSVIPTIAEGIAAYKNSKYTVNMPKATIIIPSKASDQEKYAAELLKKYIKDEDGYTPEVKTDSVSKGSLGFEISVGNTNRSHGKAKYTSDGSYKIYSYDSGISILGAGKRGTIDGTIKFLSICGGYYWLSFEDGYRTNQDHFRYSTSIDYDYERAFSFTDIDIMFGIGYEGDNRMFWLANGINGFYANLSQTNMPYYETSYLSISGNYGDLQAGQAHTLLSEYVTEAKYFKSHPEYFSLIKGERKPVQLCLTNENVYTLIKNHAFEILRSGVYDPNAPRQILSITQADNEYYCQCSNCFKARMDHQKGPYNERSGLCDAALYLDICNRLSKDIKAAGYTNVYIDMFAYTWTIEPPVVPHSEKYNDWDWMEIDDHVIVRYAAISRCYSHDCDDTSCERNNEMINHLNGWAQLCNKGNAQLWIWDYNINYRSTSAPYLNIYALAHDIKYYRDIGVSGVYLQSNDAHNKTNTEFGDLRNYLSVVLLENPDADWEMEMQFFAHEFYGDSAPYILEALDMMETQAKRHSGDDTYYTWYYRDRVMTYNCTCNQVFNNAYPAEKLTHNRMPDDEIAACEALWNLALAAADNDTPTHRFHTYRTHVCWRWIKSTLKVYEFKDPSTYAQKNKELFDDIFDTYGSTILSIDELGRDSEKPDSPYLNHIPDYWLYSEELSNY